MERKWIIGLANALSSSRACCLAVLTCERARKFERQKFFSPSQEPRVKFDSRIHLLNNSALWPMLQSFGLKWQCQWWQTRLFYPWSFWTIKSYQRVCGKRRRNPLQWYPPSWVRRTHPLGALLQGRNPCRIAFRLHHARAVESVVFQQFWGDFQNRMSKNGQNASKLLNAM